MYTVSFLGCGKLGQTIGRLIVRSSAANVLAVCNTSLRSSESATKFIGAGLATADLREIPQ